MKPVLISSLIAGSAVVGDYLDVIPQYIQRPLYAFFDVKPGFGVPEDVFSYRLKRVRDLDKVYLYLVNTQTGEGRLVREGGEFTTWGDCARLLKYSFHPFKLREAGRKIVVKGARAADKAIESLKEDD
ncbi:hypothetical protein D6783_01140 [Candidatus Woesearchaeota archaeon]|nr:MAG: hypothetical protein D6783_01140 [Candidatus Woesearchaeota archaeon]